MKKIIGILFLLIITTYSWALTDREKSICDVVAAERGLTREEMILLYSIREHENGAPGLEFGVVQPCARYYKDGFISLIVQADYCAWIIKERYRGDIGTFSHTYHNGNLKTDAEWSRCVRAYYRQFKKTKKSRAGSVQNEN
jgi:hypothetical protein